MPDTVATPSPVGADSARPYRRMTLPEYAGRILGPRAIGRDVALALFDQVIHRPKEWDRTWHGYGNRFTSRLGSAAIAQTFVLAVSVARDERHAAFELCTCRDRDERIMHALLTPLRVDTPEGTRLSWVVPASEVAGSLLMTTLHPRGWNVRDGLVGGATSLVVSSLFSTAREFWPWHRRPPGF